MQEITPEVSIRAEARREPTISGKSLIAKSYLRCLILLMFATALTASAQFRTSIQGVVTDTTGAVIPGDRKSTRLNSSHLARSRMPSSA